MASGTLGGMCREGCVVERVITGRRTCGPKLDKTYSVHSLVVLGIRYKQDGSPLGARLLEGDGRCGKGW